VNDGHRVSKACDATSDEQSSTQREAAMACRIPSHLVENLSVDRDDLDLIPAFGHEGGWRAAEEVFRGRIGAFPPNSTAPWRKA
jgi:type I restriction enzyme R subunit